MKPNYSKILIDNKSWNENILIGIMNYELWIMNWGVGEMGGWGGGGGGGRGDEGRREKKADGWQKVLSGGYI
jgi:hypothetical protein